MADSIPETTDKVTEPHRRRRGNVRSFVWTPEDGDEITACNDCRFWHAQITLDDDGSYGINEVSIREWHESDCPVWDEQASD